MSRTRIHNFAISLDGFATGEPQTLETPFGHAGRRLHNWMMATRFWDPAGSTGIDYAFAQRNNEGIGAEIMGANKFGPPGWQDDPDWKGWWGENPPFHTPTFVLTHHPRPAIEMDGDTTFHFLATTPGAALEIARAAADGLDVRIGGGDGAPQLFDATGQKILTGRADELHPFVAGRRPGRGHRGQAGIGLDGLGALKDREDEVEGQAV